MPPTPRTRILGASLRNARIEANFGLRELARRIGVAPAMLSSWEQARRAPSLADVAGILGAIGAVGEARRDILHIAKSAAEQCWVVRGTPGSPARTIALAAHDESAQSIVTWDPFAIPEVLRIPRLYPDTQLAPLEAFVSDHAIRDGIGIAGQTLRFTARAVAGPRSLTLHVVPSEMAWKAGLTTAFDRYSMDSGETVVYCGQKGLGIFTVDPCETGSPYEADIELIRQITAHHGKTLRHPPTSGPALAC
ncbi:helix-turn-helix domain-containing protein [Amycolatopsis echigonensis]|uniref:Helix-turn-helix transcriptional regulator n=1 Tax=Amycolatopsis echigonensis TaxID=2576905 RepID=A0A8E1VV48_9PSEU|nr:helix-turn-helix domain-containing protein [Amycolatopsis echigonensis]MBB2498807.1 helix-turn-helix transcriptional regulator [Amycolatopsis echigonensis]